MSISADNTYRALLPKFAISWYPTDDSTYGFQIARGYNAGGGGIAFNGVLVSTYEFDPEYVWNYELFGRHSFANCRITTTQNIFFSRYKDMQLPFDITPNIAGDESYVIADTQLAYNFKHVRVFGSIRNMFDANEPVAKPSEDTAVLLQPRTVMVGLQTSF